MMVICASAMETGSFLVCGSFSFLRESGFFLKESSLFSFLRESSFFLKVCGFFYFFLMESGFFLMGCDSFSLTRSGVFFLQESDVLIVMKIYFYFF